MAKLTDRWVLTVFLADGKLQHTIERKTMTGYRFDRIHRYGYLTKLKYVKDINLINDEVIYEIKLSIRNDIEKSITKTEESISIMKDALQKHKNRLKETDELLRSDKLERILNDKS